MKKNVIVLIYSMFYYRKVTDFNRHTTCMHWIINSVIIFSETIAGNLKGFKTCRSSDVMSINGNENVHVRTCINREGFLMT